MPYHVRLAELFFLQKRRQLTDTEVLDMTHCLAASAKYCWDLVALKNMSLAAYQVGDMEWLHDICNQIDALEEKQATIKRPDRNGADRK
ncbi:DUF7667 family protein [Paenibacillus hodogayensis]